MDPVVSVQKQDFTRNPENLAKVPAEKKPKVIFTDNSIVRRHHIDRKQMGLLREQCAD